ncbi:hypothetical protein [Roseateles sp. P5_D6]
MLLTRTGWAVCQDGSLLHAETALAQSDVISSLQQWLRRHGAGRWWAPSRATIYLSGALCRPFLLPELPPLSPAERQLAIDAAAKARTGFSEPVQIWLSPVMNEGAIAGGAHQVGAAIPLQQLRELLASFRKLTRVRLVSVQPLWRLALKVALSGERDGHDAPDMLLVRDPDSVTVLAGKKGDEAVQADQHDGFAAVMTVDAAQDALNRRNVILRVVSGLEVEPTHPVQFEIGLANVESAGARPASADSDEMPTGDRQPLGELWVLRPFELASV